MSKPAHSFFIPVMGIAFTLDSPIKVAKYGIGSAISCCDDSLMEKMRRYYSEKFGKEYLPIAQNATDRRARRIRAYLNLVDEIVRQQFESLKASAFEPGSEITRYFEMLPETSYPAQLYREMIAAEDPASKARLQARLREHVRPGPIDVNIMTKLDRTNLDAEGKPLPSEFSDALAALRGYAGSTLEGSSVVFSAGFNGRLYSYIEQFVDFFPDEQGVFKKKITLKVKDYRSAFTQAKFLAKKGLWVSEYQVESGLNCGGHAFGDGWSLLGVILEEFKVRREELSNQIFEIYNKALAQKGRKTFAEPHPIRITAQGGLGTAQEHCLLIDYYKVDATGWGTPFLLVPEATTTDEETLKKLCEAGKDDVYLSNVSPLGVPFYTLRNSLSEIAKRERIRKDRPGSPCGKGYLASSVEFSEVPLCTASRRYQKLKLEQLKSEELSEEEYQIRKENVLAKACLCNDLGGAAISLYGLEEPGDVPAPSAVCPSPNIAYFSRVFSLKEMVDHIYGRANLLNGAQRSHVFINELRLVLESFEGTMSRHLKNLNEQSVKYLKDCRKSLLDGFAYYESLGSTIARECRDGFLQDLAGCRKTLENMIAAHGLAF